MADVLLVEDDPDMRVDLAYMLQQKGFDVMTAKNGSDALLRMKDHGVPKLILLDLMMPDMDGWTLRQVLLKHPSLEGVPVVVLSGVADVADEAKQLGTRWLTKPVDLEQFMTIVQSIEQFWLTVVKLPRP